MSIINIITSALLFLWMGVPIVTIMWLSSTNMENPSWMNLCFLIALYSYPTLIGLIYYAMGWRFWGIAPLLFLFLVATPTLICGGQMLRGTISNKINGIDPRVKIVDGVVYVKDKAVVGADPETFVILEAYDAYGKDKNHVYYMGQVIPQADARFFRPLADTFIKVLYRDQKSVFYRGKLIGGADPETFRLLNKTNDIYLGTQYYSDKNTVYASTNKVDEIVPLPHVDMKSFKIHVEGTGEMPYGVDKKSVYFQDFLIEGAEPESFNFKEHFAQERKKLGDLQKKSVQ